MSYRLHQPFEYSIYKKVYQFTLLCEFICNTDKAMVCMLIWVRLQIANLICDYYNMHSCVLFAEYMSSEHLVRGHHYCIFFILFYCMPFRLHLGFGPQVF